MRNYCYIVNIFGLSSAKHAKVFLRVGIDSHLLLE